MVRGILVGLTHRSGGAARANYFLAFAARVINGSFDRIPRKRLRSQDGRAEGSVPTVNVLVIVGLGIPDSGAVSGSNVFCRQPI
jgi:hypothetical protein